jgi:GT2 family glycosyltransferase
MKLSVVVATYNRAPLLERLLGQLSVQTLDPRDFEVVVVDDGSAAPVAATLEARAYPFPLRVVTQSNAGAAAARDRGVREAQGGVVVITDDDMQVPRHFLAAHLALHPPGSRRAVVGRIRADPDVHDMPYWERWYAHRFDTLADRYRTRTLAVTGASFHTGNCSLRRADYLAVGGFDPQLKRSEDIDLGYTLEEAGVEFVFADDAYTLHGSDHTRERAWLERAFLYGVYDSRIHRRHPRLPQANPWRFLFRIAAPARPLVAAAAVTPTGSRPLSAGARAVTKLADRLGLERATFAGAALVYTMEYFRGVRSDAGSLLAALRALGAHARERRRGAAVRPGAGVWLTLVVLLVSCGRDARAQAPAPWTPGARAGTTPAVAEALFEGGLGDGWQDFGWAERDAARRSGPERLDFSNYAGWILAHRPELTARFGGVVLRLKAPASHGDFLQVRLDSAVADVFPRVRVGPQHRRELADGWTEVLVPMAELNPLGAPFDKVVLRAWARVPKGWVAVDGVGLTVVDAQAPAASAPVAARPAVFTVDCRAPAQRISPGIYGIAFSARKEFDGDHQWQLGATARRWGGNPSSRYNWALGNAWNTGADWYFRNVGVTSKPDFSWRDFFASNAQHGVRTALTVPLLGWVAKDTTSFSFSTEALGPQRAVDPSLRRAGDGRRASGQLLEPPPPTTTSVEAPPAFIGAWLDAVARAGHAADLVIFDNEPMLWNDTHRDVHPQPTTYDELLERTVAYGSAVRTAAPRALIAGPALWGWPAYFHSAKDVAFGLTLRPDRRAHGDEPLVTWYLSQLAAHEQRTGTRLLDVLDVHFYPQGRGIGLGEDGDTDAETNARRIRSTRALWDPTYRDESWIGEAIALIPRMRSWVSSSYPGLALALGEYNFGAEKHPSGGLALAEALGRFGQQGLSWAFYWTVPPERSPAFYAFRAYRDYDGRGARFQDFGLPTTAPADASAFAARDEASTTMTVVLLNFSPVEALDGAVTLQGCPAVASQRLFSYRGAPAGFDLVDAPVGKPLRLPAYSINVLELSLARAAR